MGESTTEIRLRSGSHTSVGQVRENNEDNLHLWSSPAYVLAVVADGMGGAAAGEEASRLAVEAVESGLVSATSGVSGSTLEGSSDNAIIHRLRDAIRLGNHNIVARAAIDPELRGMGTTVTLAFVRGHRALVAHVGDSRAYLVDGGTGLITQITDDHSFVEALVAAGHLTQEQAEEHPMRNVLYRALGQNEDIDIDVYEAQLRAGDRLVLCSDGLTRHVKAREIAEISLSIDDPEIASQALVDLANSRGGEDNVSVIVVKLEGDSDEEDTQAAAVYQDPDDTLDLSRIRPLLNEIIERSERVGSKTDLPLDGAADQRAGADARSIHPDSSATAPVAFDPSYERLIDDMAHEGHDTRLPRE
jgi:protein phosphatase